MPKLLFIIPFLLSMTFVNGQKNAAIIQWNYTEPIFVYDSTLKLVIDTIQNDSINENFIGLNLIESNKESFKVHYKLEMEKIYKVGYLIKTKFIGAFVRHESFPTMTINLFEEANSSSTKNVYDNWKPHFVTVKDFKNDWYKIEIYWGGSVLDSNFIGWIRKIDLCPNNYTTCN